MNNKTALITGASSGIGRVFAEKLAQEGYNITGVARNEEKLKELVKQLGDGHDYITADLTDTADLDKLADTVSKRKYSLLINNAGYGLYGHFESIPLEKHQNLMFLNMDALVRLSYVYLQHASSGDALINVSSALSRLTYPGGAVYSGTKGFVTHFTESLWYEFKDRDIYVMALLPGITFTNFHNVAFGKDVKMPKNIGYPPEVVVDEAINALKERQRPSLISGPKVRKMTNFATRFLTRKKMISIMGQRNPAIKK